MQTFNLTTLKHTKWHKCVHESTAPVHAGRLHSHGQHSANQSLSKLSCCLYFKIRAHCYPRWTIKWARVNGIMLAWVSLVTVSTGIIHTAWKHGDQPGINNQVLSVFSGPISLNLNPGFKWHWHLILDFSCVSFDSNRLQCVKMCGVPQGSVFGSILFTI